MFFHNQDIISLLTNIFDIKQFTILKIIGGISTILIIIKTILELKTKWKDNKALKIINNEITFEFFDEETIKSYTDIYIEPYCSPSDPSYTEDLKKIYGEKKHEKLFTKIDEFLSEGAKNRHMYLLGDSGTGKTAALINILMRNYRHKKFSKKQIIVLRLNAKNVDQCIKNIENKKNTILFLDAFDEDPFAIESINTRYNQLVDITEGFNRVLISSRTQFFPNSAAIKRKTSIPNINADQSDGYRMFTIQYLLPFNDEQVQKFIKKKYSILNYKLRRKAWQIISAAPSLALRPMLLKYMSSFMDPNKEYKNSYDIYEEIIIHWINRERISDKVALRRFSEALANHLYRYQKENNGQIPRHELVPFALTHKIDLNELELSSRSLLNRDGYGNYKFSHRSILEFLFINYFVKLPVKDRVFLDWTDQIKKFVAELVKLHYSQEIDLSEADLTGLNFSDCNLSGLKLVRANLMGANLNNVNLMEAVLTEANLRDADLKGAVISEANLGKADLRRAKLNNATLSEVILCNANLSDSILNEAYLSGADLEGICLSNADLKGANLEGTNLSNADLKSANLNNTSLAGANLTSSILTNAELSYSNLKGAKLCKAILNGANFSMANLSNADLQDANIQGINLKGSILFQTNFHGIDIKEIDHNGVNLNEIIFTDNSIIKDKKKQTDIRKIIPDGINNKASNLKQANLKGMKFNGINNKKSNLKRTDLMKINLSGVDYQGANLSGVILKGADLSEIDFSGANLSGSDFYMAKFRGANLNRVNLSKSKLNGVNLSGMDLSGINLSEANLSGAFLTNTNLRNAKLDRVRLKNANLSGADLRATNLSRTNLNRTKLKGAYFDGDTKFPKGFNPDEHAMVYKS